ncbi:hypothetical protein [uncultured Arthrobacter sp.]|uniref:hypothetical protein n=1 Tax=uncultured Arthrobacter sp. TaxID=114050 RepID=UPI0028D158F8|nr:hypothetical protein [uncultured Arthrobacter sp.]
MSGSKTTEPYPEHAKQAAVVDESEAIGRFLDEGPYVLAEYREFDDRREPQLVPVAKSLQQVLADWFGIDLKKIEEEKRRMLESLRAMNTATADSRQEGSTSHG